MRIVCTHTIYLVYKLLCQDFILIYNTINDTHTISEKSSLNTVDSSNISNTNLNKNEII